MSDAFTIRIFVPDGDPEGVRVVDRMNWTGAGIAFPRSKWLDVKQRQEFGKSGVYLLIGYREGTADELPTIHVGKAARDIRGRIDSHFKNKEFWDTGVVFVSPRGELNAAHVDWLEYALVERATSAGRCHLDNDNVPSCSNSCSAVRCLPVRAIPNLLEAAHRVAQVLGDQRLPLDWVLPGQRVPP